VTITGLRSVWTNYAIQVVNATDSGTLGFTNTIITGTGGTEELTYNVPLGHAVVGGLSTASGLRTEDSLSIHGAPAANTSAGRLASTIAGFIITDVPVITMSPQQVLVCAGDTVTWSGYAVGVPPLSYQWRKNGVPIPGATSPSYSITNVTTANAGTYDLLVTNLYGSALSSPVTTDGVTSSRINNLVLDSNFSGPERDGLNYGATWLASNTAPAATAAAASSCKTAMERSRSLRTTQPLRAKSARSPRRPHCQITFGTRSRWFMVRTRATPP
jgi:hypothetical protein